MSICFAKKLEMDMQKSAAASIHANTIHKTKTEFHNSNELESQYC